MTVRETSGPVTHPPILWGWVRVDVTDHPDVKALYDGAPALGWEADPRLCLYKNDAERAVMLVRFEHDGEYRMVGRHTLSTDEVLFGGPKDALLLGAEAVNHMIRGLIAHDHRRGFDPNIVIANTLAKHAENDRVFSEWIREDMAPRLADALMRSYLPGVPLPYRTVSAKR